MRTFLRRISQLSFYKFLPHKLKSKQYLRFLLTSCNDFNVDEIIARRICCSAISKAAFLELYMVAIAFNINKYKFYWYCIYMFTKI